MDIAPFWGGRKSVLKNFQRMLDKGRLAHAYLFVGEDPTENNRLAGEVARVLQCQDLSAAGVMCRVCSSCRRVAAGRHPDIHYTTPADGGAIKREAIRDILEKARLRPFSSARQVFVVQEADRLTPEAANTLLKTLEEPRPDTFLLLTSTALDRVLPTIRSRCHVVRVAFREGDQVQEGSDTVSLSANRLIPYLRREGVGPDRVPREQEIWQRRDAMLKSFVWAQDVEPFVKKIVTDKEETKVFLILLVSWIRDGWLLKAGGPAACLLHGDRIDDLRRFCEDLSSQKLWKVYEDVVQAYRMSRENFNVKIPIFIIKETLNDG